MMIKGQKSLLQCKKEALHDEFVHETAKEIKFSLFNKCYHDSVHLPANETVQPAMGLLHSCFSVYEEPAWDDTTTPNGLVKITDNQLVRAEQQLNDALRPCSLFITDTDDIIDIDIKCKDLTYDIFEERIPELPLDVKKRFPQQKAFRRKVPVNVFESQNVHESGNESGGLLADDDIAESEAQTSHDDNQFRNPNNVLTEGNHESRARIDANTESSLCSLIMVYMLLLLICLYSIVIISLYRKCI